MFNITNYNEHPTRKAYTIFHFFTKERADYFNQLLNEKGIWFEFDLDETPNKTTYFFGVKNADLKTVHQLNYLVIAKYRKPTISYSPLRIFLFLFLLIIIFLVVMGLLNASK